MSDTAASLIQIIRRLFTALITVMAPRDVVSLGTKEPKWQQLSRCILP